VLSAGGQARSGLPVRDSFDEVLADPRVDIVNLSGPNQVHTRRASRAANAGKHILGRKPMALTMDENRALRDAVARAGVKSVVSFVLRWNRCWNRLRSLLAAGRDGDLLGIEVITGTASARGTALGMGATRSRRAAAHAAWGCHALDALRFLAGHEVVEVSAMSNNKKGPVRIRPPMSWPR